MKINQNISAVIVNDQLLRNENSLSESVKKLSAGLKFTSAKDNPSGVAISYKMQAQINALNRASSNATDGTSMVQTIDGAMGEITEVLQRMRELCVQAGNQTNGPEDLDAMQQEIAALKEEVNRISSDTEFNGKKLLDGSLDRRTYVTAFNKDTAVNKRVSMFDQITNVIISDEVQAGEYRVNIDSAATKLVAESAGGGGSYDYVVKDETTGAKSIETENGPLTAITPELAGRVTINGATAVITEGMTAGEVYEELRKAGETGWIDVSLQSGNLMSEADSEFKETLQFESVRYGSEAKLDITCDNPSLGQFLGLNTTKKDKDENNEDIIVVDTDTVTTTQQAKDAVVKLSDTANKPYGEYTTQATVKVTGNDVVITDKSGFEISFEITDVLGTAKGVAVPVEITIEATDIGTLQLQIGANEDQELAVRVPVLNTKSLYIEDVDVTKSGGPDMGMTQLDIAISITTTARAKMGAYENSLDFTQKSLDATIEDMTNAISRLADVDMAAEMTTYTNANVLTQASISILAQANDLPQQVLSLLQG